MVPYIWGVSINSEMAHNDKGTPKWFIMEHPIKIDD
jgi:hypothetical protein